MKPFDSIISLILGFSVGRLFFILTKGQGEVELFIFLFIVLLINTITAIQSFLLWRKLQIKIFPYFVLCYMSQIGFLLLSFNLFYDRIIWLYYVTPIIIVLIYFWSLSIKERLNIAKFKENYEQLYSNMQRKRDND